MNPSDAQLAPGQRFDKDYAYGQYTADYYSGLLDKENRASHKWRLKWVERCLAPKAGDRIADLGCGAGLVDRYFLKKGAEVHGVDLAEEAIKAAIVINKELPKGHFRVGDASKCDHLESATFDKACSVDVIEHCGHDVMLDIFAEAHRLLKPGGLYFVYTPNPKHWIERFKDWGFILKQDPTHTGLRPAAPILAGLREKGFEIVEHLRPPSMIPVFNWFERVWSAIPAVGELAVYRIAVLARKK
jgi:2-polyprenyl-6-hydroxyphenyl methylase/3-demethylubiquinone-9 3-methyltransferase